MTRALINTTDLMAPGWRFMAGHMPDPALDWSTFTSQAYGGPARLRRLRAVSAAALAARRARKTGRQPLLISHLPNMAALTNFARRGLCPSVPQIAFSFNFTALPNGSRRRAYLRGLRGIDEFVVFSAHEKQLYARELGLPPDRIRVLKWAMDPPELAPSADTPEPPYLCSIGGEARDYRLLAAAMRRLPDRRAVVVARPYSIHGIDFPDNVELRLNLPAPETWRLATGSVGLALPLLSYQTACGHITLVAAKLLGVPVVATECLGLAEYLADGTIYSRVAPGDTDAMAEAIEGLFTDTDAAQAIAQTAQIQARSDHAPETWLRYLEDALTRL
ncbi:MAG: hypothetical protein RID23_03510 [Roseovarius sp.]